MCWFQLYEVMQSAFWTIVGSQKAYNTSVTHFWRFESELLRPHAPKHTPKLTQSAKVWKISKMLFFECIFWFDSRQRFNFQPSQTCPWWCVRILRAYNCQKHTSHDFIQLKSTHGCPNRWKINILHISNFEPTGVQTRWENVLAACKRHFRSSSWHII